MFVNFQYTTANTETQKTMFKDIYIAGNTMCIIKID